MYVCQVRSAVDPAGRKRVHGCIVEVELCRRNRKFVTSILVWQIVVVYNCVAVVVVALPLFMITWQFALLMLLLFYFF